MAGVNFIEALETLKSMFPELDTVTLRYALDSKGGHMESAVEELLQISRRQRGVGGGGGGRMGGFGDDDGEAGGVDTRTSPRATAPWDGAVMAGEHRDPTRPSATERAPKPFPNFIDTVKKRDARRTRA